MRTKKIKIRYTEKEWEVIKKHIPGKTNINAYINRKIIGLSNLYEKCPPCVEVCTGKSVQKQHRLSGQSFEILKKICEELNTDPGVLISRLILDPLLFGE